MKRIISTLLLIALVFLCGCGSNASSQNYTENKSENTVPLNTMQPVTEYEEEKPQIKNGVCYCDVICDNLVALFGIMDELGINYNNANFDKVLSEKLGTPTTLDEVSDYCFHACITCVNSKGEDCSCGTVCTYLEAIIATVKELNINNTELNAQIDRYIPNGNGSLINLLEYFCDLSYECYSTH